MTAYELQQRMKNYNLTIAIAKAIKKSKKVLIGFNRAQLMKGRNSNNTKIQPKYKSKSWAKYKRKRNTKPGYGVPDIFDKGDYQEGIDVIVKGKTYDFKSSDSKATMLETKYPFLLGTTAKDTEKYSKETLLPILREDLKKRISS